MEEWVALLIRYPVWAPSSKADKQILVQQRDMIRPPVVTIYVQRKRKGKRKKYIKIYTKFKIKENSRVNSLIGFIKSEHHINDLSTGTVESSEVENFFVGFGKLTLNSASISGPHQEKKNKTRQNLKKMTPQGEH